MKKNFYLAIALLGFSVSLNAQTAKKGVGIKTDTPQTTLDVRAEATDTSMPDGVLVPRLDVGQLNAKSAVYGADQNGALVFVTSNTQGGAGTKVENVKDPGFYYYDHATSKWKGVGGGGDAGQIKGPMHAVVSGPNANVRTSATLTSSTWTSTDFGIFINGSPLQLINLPDASANAGRILFVSNLTGGGVTWNQIGTPGQYKPLKGTTMKGGDAVLVISDGSAWHILAGGSK
jgi:hypothetical protein